MAWAAAIFARYTHGSKEETFMPYVIFLGVLFVVLCVLAVREEKRTVEYFQQLAKEKGYEYDDKKSIKQMLEFSPYGEHSSTPSRHILRGARAGVDFTIANVDYRRKNLRKGDYHLATFFILTSPDIDLPEFELRREFPGVDSLLTVLGQQDINFPADEAFSKAFVVGGSSESRIRIYLDQNRREALLRWSKTLPIPNVLGHFAGAGSSFVVHFNTAIAPEKWLEVLDHAVTLAGDLSEQSKK
jgi:hypothetical protein